MPASSLDAPKAAATAVRKTESVQVSDTGGVGDAEQEHRAEASSLGKTTEPGEGELGLGTHEGGEPQDDEERSEDDGQTGAEALDRQRQLGDGSAYDADDDETSRPRGDAPHGGSSARRPSSPSTPR